MGSKSFDTFYFLLDKSLHSVAEVQREYEEMNGNLSRFKGFMFCPECKVAELSFTRKTHLRREYLSKLPNSRHSFGCSYIHDYASNKEVISFVKSLTHVQIQERLETALNLLCNKRVSSEDKEHVNYYNPFVIPVKSKRGVNSICKTIRRKSINSWFDKDECDQMYIFYGKVKLCVKGWSKVDGGIEKRFYKLMVYTLRKGVWKFKITVFRGGIRDDVDCEAVYDLAILGSIGFFGECPQIKTATLTSIKMRKIVLKK
ncbi:hypothetical protein [Ornithobacterium rhinotracheale]|uniref:hypothetical protein n=1 Tax=Ornithobacterium rhinotracheale TaxID=28251 RepID=UPI00129C1565|nr:hypothetical protein [Ornithobacterium rhinotracheale]MRI63310.1 hypothetical protein [Ornithobacterium rhinotracheale]